MAKKDKQKDISVERNDDPANKTKSAEDDKGKVSTVTKKMSTPITPTFVRKSLDKNIKHLNMSSRDMLRYLKESAKSMKETVVETMNTTTTPSPSSNDTDGNGDDNNKDGKQQQQQQQQQQNKKTATATTTTYKETEERHYDLMAICDRDVDTTGSSSDGDSSASDNNKEPVAVVSPQDEIKLRIKNEKIVYRDFSFLIVAMILGSIMGFVEMHSNDVVMRGGNLEDVSQGGIVDTGFILTKNFNEYLKNHRDINDYLAAINTIIGVAGPMIYMIYQTLWVGDYDVVFRYLAISAARSLCGWVTYLPPDPTYLVSYYDFPDIMHCIIEDCGDPRNAKVQPFVSFFSGHVATLVINANHMYIHGYKNLGIFFHIFDIFQIIRLLATRGHYSIDIVIGWFMAVYVSNPAGRLGRHFSRGDKSLQELFVPVSSKEAFESLAGVRYIRAERRVSTFFHQPGMYDKYMDTMDNDGPLPAPAARRVATEFLKKGSSWGDTASSTSSRPDEAIATEPKKSK